MGIAPETVGRNCLLLASDGRERARPKMPEIRPADFTLVVIVDPLLFFRFGDASLGIPPP
jgi:hypothetical protein